MFTSKTPYRVSFFGGGTDYEGWYSENGGAFISMGIDKYCYLMARRLPPFFDYKSRLVWSKIEQVKKVSEIQHPAIRAGLEHENVEDVEVFHIGDLPARSGLGSSSSFAVGLLHVLRKLREVPTDKYSLACDAIHLERTLLKEAGGIQDQIAAAYGGLNYVEIEKSGEFNVNQISLSEDSRQKLKDSLLLVFTGIFRNSFELASEQSSSVKKNAKQLEKIRDITEHARKILGHADFVKDFGELLNETWVAKKSIHSKISNSVVDQIYEAAIQAGAYGGKLLGAGAGGFMIFVVPEARMKAVKRSLNGLINTSIGIDVNGTQAYSNNIEMRDQL